MEQRSDPNNPMEKVISAVEMEEITLPAQATIKVELSVISEINITSYSAQRRVNKLLLDRLGLFYSQRRSLVVGERLLWRVPVWLSLPTTGPLGPVGTLDVDAQTGEILYTPEILDDLKEHGHVLAQRATSQAS